MAVVEINWNPSPKQLRVFSMLQVIFFAIVAAWLHYGTSYERTATIVLVVSLVVGVVGFAWPPPMRVVYVVWMAIVFPIGWTVSHVVLAVLFYLVITPIAIIMKLCRYDSMQRKFDRQAATYWKRREPNDDTSRYFKQF
jgi:hypothetical protein